MPPKVHSPPSFDDEGNRVLVPVFGRRLAGMAAEEFAESGGIAEAELVGYLLDGKFGFAQENRSLGDQHVGDGLVGAFARVTLADARQVMGGYAQFAGIETHFVLLGRLGFEQGEETVAEQGGTRNLLGLQGGFQISFGHFDDFGVE